MPTEFTLSSGEVVLLRDKNTSKKYATGTNHPTNNWGDAEIVGQGLIDKYTNTQYVVSFPNNFLKLTNKQKLMAGNTVGDDRTSNKDNKICWGCKQEKPHTLKVFPFGRNFCFICEHIKRKEYEEKNKTKLQFTRKRGHKKWAKQNKKHRATYSRKYNSNPKNKLRQVLSSSLTMQLKKVGTTKPSSTMIYVGTTKELLVKHLNKGQYTMEDYNKNTKGNILFHIDHIIPSSYYMDQLVLAEENNIVNEDILYKWWNYRNLRVWPAIDNISKSNNIDAELIKQHEIEDLLTLGETI
jgi:hypothetical protein